jgi:hypothetical protein
MNQLYLLDNMKSMSQLSLISSISEYFDWQDSMEEFFKGFGFTSVINMYYAKETFDKDVLQWWLNVDDSSRTWENMTLVLQ